MDRHVPFDPLFAIFTPEVVAKLAGRQNRTDQLEHRLEVLNAGGLKTGFLETRRRSIKSAWETYLHAAFALGLLDGVHGNELRRRLTGHDDDSFRSAMSECMAAWFLAGKLRLQVEPRPDGKPGRPLEFSIKHADGDVHVEVKASYRPLKTEYFWGDDSDMLVEDLREANKQFARGVRNLLVLNPQMRVPITLERRTPLERAFVGETIISIPIDPKTGGPAGPESFPFKQSGQLTRTGKEPPRFTRVSGVLYIGEFFSDDYRELRHFALLVRNPNALAELPTDLWADIPYLSRTDGRWAWSDTGTAGLLISKPAP
jgi:hypothetical protein